MRCQATLFVFGALAFFADHLGDLHLEQVQATAEVEERSPVRSVTHHPDLGGRPLPLANQPADRRLEPICRIGGFAADVAWGRFRPERG